MAGSSMKVVLPDNSELELPDFATGLEAARAIGPKLAEQAVLVRVDGQVQDLRLPLADGEKKPRFASSTAPRGCGAATQSVALAL